MSSAQASVHQLSTTDYGLASDPNAVTVTTTSSSTNGGAASTSTTTTAFAWYGAAQTASVSVTGSGGTAATAYAYLATGQLTDVSVGGTRPRQVHYQLDSDGEAIRRDEGTSGTGDGTNRPHQLWYRFAGREIGTFTNDGGDDWLTHTDYTLSEVEREDAAGTPGTGNFANGATAASSTARFGASPDPVSSYDQGSQAGSYTVRAGDTLSSIVATPPPAPRRRRRSSRSGRDSGPSPRCGARGSSIRGRSGR